MSSSNGRRAVVLLSGGLDSATVLALARRDVAECTALTFDYGQKHAVEVAAARAVAAAMDVTEHLVVRLPLGPHVRSALVTDSIAIPKGGARDGEGGVPTTYVPARNTVFLAFALAVAETTESDRIYIGVSSIDYSGYPDCRPEFIAAFQRLADLATRRTTGGQRVEICAPLQHQDKAATIRTGMELGVDYALTVTCYDPDASARACGSCDACRWRRRGFESAGVPDPTRYRPAAGAP